MSMQDKARFGSILPEGRIERRMSYAALTGGELLAVGALGACLIASVVTYHDASSGEWNACLLRGGQQAPVSMCHHRYFGVIVVLFLLFSVTAFGLIRSRRKIWKSLGTLGPSLVIEDGWLWCDQLVEPILFADVEAVHEQFFHGNLRGLALELRKPAPLVHSEGLEPKQQQCFTYDAFGYPDRKQLLATIAHRIRAAAVARITPAPR